MGRTATDAAWSSGAGAGTGDHPARVARAQTPAATIRNATTTYPPDQSPALVRIAAAPIGSVSPVEPSAASTEVAIVPGTTAATSDAAAATAPSTDGWRCASANPPVVRTRVAARTAAAAPRTP